MSAARGCAYALRGTAQMRCLGLRKGRSVELRMSAAWGLAGAQHVGRCAAWGCSGAQHGAAHERSTGLRRGAAWGLRESSMGLCRGAACNCA